MLRFNMEGLTNEILNALENELQWVFQAWENEVISKMKFQFFQVNADVDFELKRQSKAIIAYLKANTYVLADSYGTGSLMLEDNPGFQAYKSTWHKDRKSKEITGRDAGEYTDLFGRKRTSSGYLKGINIEGIEMMNGYKIEPVSPSYAIQDAEKFLYGTYLPRAFSNAIKQINFSKYLIES